MIFKLIVKKESLANSWAFLVHHFLKLLFGDEIIDKFIATGNPIIILYSVVPNKEHISKLIKSLRIYEKESISCGR